MRIIKRIEFGLRLINEDWWIVKVIERIVGEVLVNLVINSWNEGD